MRSTITALLLLFALVATSLAKEVLILQNDGRIEGEIIADETLDKKQYRIKTPSGGQLVIDKSAVKQVVIVGKDETEYDRLRTLAPDTVEGQWKLAEWCREKKMPKQRVPHLERVIALEPDHQQARLALGYSQINGRWLHRDEWMKERGYVLFKGEWKLPQEVELLEQQAVSKTQERDWYAKLNRLKADYLNGTPNKSQEAWQKLLAIDDPYAVPAILQELKSEKLPRLLRAYIEALGRISNGPASALWLIWRWGPPRINTRNWPWSNSKKERTPTSSRSSAANSRAKTTNGSTAPATRSANWAMRASSPR